MTVRTDTDLSSLATTIRDETTPAANTASRVGSMFVDGIESKGHKQTTVASATNLYLTRDHNIAICTKEGGDGGVEFEMLGTHQDGDEVTIILREESDPNDFIVIPSASELIEGNHYITLTNAMEKRRLVFSTALAHDDIYGEWLDFRYADIPT
jgi:hypothetical protein